MRRRRHVLQVSTFPFLAVLLCTMGALMLLMLVIDKRAKAAARNKALLEAASHLEEEEKTVDARKAELEKRHEALHADLLGQHNDLHGKLQDLAGQMHSAEAKLGGSKTRVHSLQEMLHAEIASLDRATQSLTNQRTAVAEEIKKADSSQKEFTGLTADLHRLEQTLADLKAARERDKQTYSLVPYRGKRGDNRRPLYIECSLLGLIFHPDHKRIRYLTNNDEEIRMEVEDRIARQAKAREATDVKDKTTPYLFLLVRPDGITSYYSLQRALRGLNLDFGYEFVDADWVLDFPEDDTVVADQPWMKREGPKADVDPHVQATGKNSTRLGKPVTGVRLGSSLTNSSGHEDESSPKSGQGGAVGGSGREPRLGSSSPGSGGGSGQVAKGAGDYRGNGQVQEGVGTAGFGHPGNSPERTADTPGNVAERPGKTPGGGNLEPGELIAAGRRGSDGGTRGSSTDHGGDNLASDSMGRQGKGPGGKGSSGGQTEGSDSSNEGNLGPKGPGKSGPVGVSGLPYGSGQGSNIGKGATGDRVEQNGNLGGTSSKSGPNPGQRVEGEGEAGGDSSGEDSSLGQPPPVLPATKPNKNPPKERQRLAGNRDWFIPIECYADRIVLPSAGLKVATSSLANDKAEAAALLEAIKKVIDRRQAAVRPGEPLFRPQLRFLVKAGGLRTYHEIYPLLEKLNLPMARQEIEPPLKEK